MHAEQRDARPPGSGSIENPTYWWYRARARLMEQVLAEYVRDTPLLIDVGSADGPSVGWLAERTRRIPIDIDPSGLRSGSVCASADVLPFGDASVDALAAFDVIEHFADEAAIVRELHRVLRPAGRLLVSVPAYRWAWSAFDVQAGHHRRYTRARIVRALRVNGFTVDRATYAFAGTFPLFAADRLRSRLLRRRGERVRDSNLSPRAERALLGLCRFDERVLRRANLPFGSSIFVAARKPG